MRVAYYYSPRERLSHDDPRNNPYGTLLAEALERRGVEVEFARDFDENYLRANQRRVDVVHLNWLQLEYYDDDARAMSGRMRDFVDRLGLARDLGYGLVWTAHNLYPHLRTHQSIDHEARLATCRLATAVIAHCEVAADEVRRAFGRTSGLFVIPHGHFVGAYPDLYTREQARAALGVPDGAFVYGLFAGNLRPYKGIEHLIDTFRRLAGEDNWLVLSGGSKDAYGEALRAYADGHPRIALRTYARAPSEDVSLIMRAANAIVLPFVAATTSGTLILALSWAKPVVAPALGCLPETVDSAAGILYDPTEPDALYRAMLAIREREPDAASRAALACAERLDWDDIAAKTVEAYRA